MLPINHSVSLREKDLNEIIAEASRRGFEHSQFTSFVETGTLLGGTVISLAHLFLEVHTIEVNRPSFLAARLASWKAKKPICFHFGDSEIILPEILPFMQGPTVLFLDAHFVGGPTGGMARVPLLGEMQAIGRYLQQPALIVVDDLAMFGKTHKFDRCDEKLYVEQRNQQTDWRSISCNSVCSCLPADQIACSFELSDQDRFVICLLPLSHPAQSLRHSYELMSSDTYFISVPGRLDLEVLQDLRNSGKGWAELADRITDKYHKSNPILKPSEQSSIEHNLQKPRMTKNQCDEMQDLLVEVFVQEGFQKLLHDAWAHAAGNIRKQFEAKDSVCLSLQLPIIAKYNFEPSKKGLIDAYLASQPHWMSGDGVILFKCSFVKWLVRPDYQLRAPDPVAYLVADCKADSANQRRIRELIAEPPYVDYFASLAQQRTDRARPPPTFSQRRRKEDVLKITAIQCHDLHDEIIEIFCTPDFQKQLRVAWFGANGDKVEQVLVHKDLCWSLEFPIIGKYNFETSVKGLRAFRLVSDSYSEKDKEMAVKGLFLNWLSNPDWQDSNPGFCVYVECWPFGEELWVVVKEMEMSSYYCPFVRCLNLAQRVQFKLSSGTSLSGTT